MTVTTWCCIVRPFWRNLSLFVHFAPLIPQPSDPPRSILHIGDVSELMPVPEPIFPNHAVANDNESLVSQNPTPASGLSIEELWAQALAQPAAAAQPPHLRDLD